MVQGLGFRVRGFSGLGLRVQGLGFKIWDVGCRVCGLGFLAWGLGSARKKSTSTAHGQVS